MQISVSIDIERSPEEVFAFVSDYERDPQWRAGVLSMQQMPPGRVQAGTRTLEIARFFLRTMTTPAEVTRYEPGRLIAFAGLMAGNIPVSGCRVVEPVSSGARFTYQATVELHGLLRPLSPLIVSILRRRFVRDLAHLKRQLETGVKEPPQA